MENSKKNLIHYAIILVFMFGFGFLPPFGTMTSFGMQIFGIFLGLIYAWTVDIVMWPCFLAILILTTVQNVTILDVISGLVAHQTLLNIIVVLVFCYALEVCGLMDYLGKWLMSREIIKKGPYHLLATFWIVAYIGAALTLDNGAVLLMLWALYYQIVEMTGIDKHSTFGSVLLIGTAIIGYIGAILFPFAVWPNIVMGIYASAAGTTFTIPFATYMIMNLMVGVLSIASFLAVTKYIIRPKTNFDLSKMHFDVGEVKMKFAQKFAALGMLLTVVILLIASLLPATIPLIVWIQSYGIVGFFILIILILSFIIDEDTKKPVIQIDDVLKNGINWKMFFILGMAFYVGGLLNSEEAGFQALLASIIGPIVSGKGVVLTIFLLVCVAGVLTNVINNVVAASLMVPFVIIIVPTLGIDATIIMIALSFMLLQGNVFPSASFTGSIMHGNKEYLTSKDVYLYASIFSAIVMLWIAVVASIFNFV